MNRLQKKCLIATAGFHLLLVLVILFGAAFFTSHEKPDETTLLTMIPSILIDEKLASGVKAAQPPAPTPPQPVQTPPQPPQPKPEPVKQPDPEPVKPAPTLVERVKEIFTPDPPKLVPVDNTEPAPKPKPHVVKVDLKKVTHTAPKVTDTSEADTQEAAKEAKAAARRAKLIAAVAHVIESKASSATTVDMPGTSSVSYANYASVVKSIYDRAWTPPDDMSGDDVNTKVSVTIGSDGTVISSRIIDKSGDAKVDASVQRTLDRVNFVAPFPDGAKEKERTFIINFNPQAKRMLG